MIVSLIVRLEPPNNATLVVPEIDTVTVTSFSLNVWFTSTYNGLLATFIVGIIKSVTLTWSVNWLALLFDSSFKLF
jgi:hypothetical protein